MVNLSSVIYDKDEMFNVWRAWDKKKISVPYGNRAYGLPDTGWALEPTELRGTRVELGHLLPHLCEIMIVKNFVRWWDQCSIGVFTCSNFISVFALIFKQICRNLLETEYYAQITFVWIGHFRVTLYLCFKTRLRAKPFKWKWVICLKMGV